MIGNLWICSCSIQCLRSCVSWLTMVPYITVPRKENIKLCEWCKSFILDALVELFVSESQFINHRRVPVETSGAYALTIRDMVDCWQRQILASASTQEYALISLGLTQSWPILESCFNRLIVLWKEDKRYNVCLFEWAGPYILCWNNQWSVVDRW